MSDNNQMSVTLNLNLDESGRTIEKVFEALTAEDKKQIARDVVKSWIEEPIGAERREKEREVLARLMQKNRYDGEKEFGSEEAARKSYQFLDGMKGFKSTREQMICEIHKEIHGLFKKEVFKLVEDSEQVEEILQAASEEFAAAIPGMMQSAMNRWFVDHLPGIAGSAFIEDDTEKHSVLLARICDRLGIDSWV